MNKASTVSFGFQLRRALVPEPSAAEGRALLGFVKEARTTVPFRWVLR